MNQSFCQATVIDEGKGKDKVKVILEHNEGHLNPILVDRSNVTPIDSVVVPP